MVPKLQIIHSFKLHCFGRPDHGGCCPQLRLAAPVLLPNFNVGCFGAITQLKSLARNRTDLFDVSAAGPAAGGAISTALFIAGLALTKSATPVGTLKEGGLFRDHNSSAGSLKHEENGEDLELHETSGFELLSDTQRLAEDQSIAGWLADFYSDSFYSILTRRLSSRKNCWQSLGLCWTAASSWARSPTFS